MGNPLNDGTWTYTWQHGRQLASMSKSGSSIAYGYNADGKRISKTVNGATYNYVYLGDQLTEMTWGSNRLRFAPIQKSRTDGLRLLYEKTLKSAESALHLYVKALLFDDNG